MALAGNQIGELTEALTAGNERETKLEEELKESKKQNGNFWGTIKKLQDKLQDQLDFANEREPNLEEKLKESEQKNDMLMGTIVELQEKLKDQMILNQNQMDQIKNLKEQCLADLNK